MVVKPINSYAEFKAIISQDKLVIIHFWATWAGACKVISPVFERFSNTYEGADYYKVDVDEQVDISQEVGIRTIPTFLFFKNGDKVGEVIGANPGSLDNKIRLLLG